MCALCCSLGLEFLSRGTCIFVCHGTSALFGLEQHVQTLSYGLSCADLHLVYVTQTGALKLNRLDLI